MTRILLFSIFLLINFSAFAQTLKNVQYISEKQFLLDKEEQKIIDEQEYQVKISVFEDEIIIDAYRKKTPLKIVSVEKSNQNLYGFELEDNQLLIVDEEANNILFGLTEGSQAILYLIENKKELDSQVTSVDEDPFNKAVSFYDQGDLNKAEKYFQKSAEAGNKMAMNNLAYMYITGDLGKVNAEKAIHWFEKSASNGDVVAMYNIGLIYDEGDGIPIDRNKALKWYKKAAAKDYALAKYNIGYLHYIDEGKHQDYQEAMKWFLRADAQNYSEAGYYIAKMYLYGLGVEKNRVEAKKWFQRSADLGSDHSQKELEKID